MPPGLLEDLEGSRLQADNYLHDGAHLPSEPWCGETAQLMGSIKNITAAMSAMRIAT